MCDIYFVLHAAALKHVSACEYNPFEVVKTNVDGTQNVIEAALEKNVERVINISTDKAINPTNTLGASKLLAERIVAAAHSFRGFRRTIFASVRFGNVLGSRGSVTELFKRQIIKRCPVTITHPDMTRLDRKSTRLNSSHISPSFPTRRSSDLPFWQCFGVARIGNGAF